VTVRPGSGASTLLVLREPSEQQAPLPVAVCLTETRFRSRGYPLADLTGAPRAAVHIKAWSDLCEIARSLNLSELVLAYRTTPPEMRRLAGLAQASGLRTSILVGEAPALDASAAISGTRSTWRVLRVPAYFERWTSRSSSAAALTRAVDISVAVLLAVVLLPFASIAAVAIAFNSRSSPVFAQTRIGERGRLFTLWKLRTMRHAAAPYATSPQDGSPDVTGLGVWLRATGLDETPQLLNIVRGDMSLVGPRPEMPFIVNAYTALERERLSARPGLTGIWQLRGDRYAAMHEQLEFDFFQVAFRSPWLDLCALGATATFTVRAAIALAARPLSRK
jgi:lipopolysaccharide/colanic/teichoic acid biosynthesis glycosyltransferase